MALIHLHPGTKTNYDPEHMLMTVSPDRIEEMLEHLMSDIADPSTRFTEFERAFITQTDAEYCRKLKNGFTDHPLSGKQIVWLSYLHRVLLERTVKVLVEDA